MNPQRASITSDRVWVVVLKARSLTDALKVPEDALG